MAKLDKGNWAVILDRKFTITLFKKQFQTYLNSKRSMKAQLWNVKLHFNVCYVSWNKKNVFNENEHDKLYPSGSVPSRIYGTPKMHKFSSSDTFIVLCLIVSSIGNFNYDIFVIFFHQLYLMITLQKMLFLLFLKLRI